MRYKQIAIRRLQKQIVLRWFSKNAVSLLAPEICVGFITGYFADDAVGKMSEVATALFGSGSKTVSSSKADASSGEK